MRCNYTLQSSVDDDCGIAMPQEEEKKNFNYVVEEFEVAVDVDEIISFGFNNRFHHRESDGVHPCLSLLD